MINREIPFRPRLEGEFRVRFYNAASEITERTYILTRSLLPMIMILMRFSTEEAFSLHQRWILA